MDSSRTPTKPNYLKSENDESNISLERLRTWTPQNFTSLLNNPQSYSFYEDIKNKLYSGLYDTNNNLEITDFSKDFEKFTDIGSPRSQSSGKSSRISKHSFKDLLNESYDEYINKIKAEYLIYKSNHHGRRQQLNSTTNINNSSNSILLNNQNLKNDHGEKLYQSNQKVYNLIPNNFFNEEGFKITGSILEKKKEEIEKYCRELIEKCGDIEFEIERILQHSSKLYSFINSNLIPLNEDVEYTYQKTQILKSAKNCIKQKFLLNSVKNIQKGEKRKTLSKLLITTKNIKAIKDILDLLKVLSKDPTKYLLTQDLINKGKELITKSDALLGDSTKKLKILKNYEEEFNKLSSKSVDKIQGEFGILLYEELSKFIVIHHESIENNDNNQNYEEFMKFYNLESLEEKEGNGIYKLGTKIFRNIEFNNENYYKNNKKFIELINILIKLDSEFFTKLRNIFTKNYFDLITNLKENLMDLIYNKQTNSKIQIDKLEIVSVQDTDKLDLLYFVILNKILRLILENFDSLSETFLKQVDEIIYEDKKKEVINKNKYSDEILEIKNILSSEIAKVLNKAIFKNLSNSLNYSNIDLFLQNYFQNVYLANSINFNDKNIFVKIEVEYLNIFYTNKEKKIKESIDCEDWTAIKIIPANHQKMVNFIMKFKLSDVSKEYHSVCKLFDQQEMNTNEEPLSNLLTFYNKEKDSQFKLILSSLDIIKIIFDTLKLLSVFDQPISLIILTHLSKILNCYIQLIKEFILEGEAFRKGRIKRLSQTEVSIASSNLCVIKHIVMAVIENNENIPKIKAVFNDLIINIDKIRQTCRCNMSDMLTSSVRDSIDELMKIDFANYPVVLEEDKRSFSEYVKKYHKINSAYASMINAFEDFDISITLQEILKIFLEKLETGMRALNEKNKLIDQNAQKQFKRDMTAVKKNLNTFSKHTGGYLEIFQEKVDTITKIVLPKVSTKKKQIVEDNNK